MYIRGTGCIHGVMSEHGFRYNGRVALTWTSDQSRWTVVRCPGCRIYILLMEHNNFTTCGTLALALMTNARNKPGFSCIINVPPTPIPRV